MRKPVPGTEFGGRVIGTEQAWALEELPQTLAVIGAGASGAEIASAYGRMGVEVHLFEALDRVLPTEDADISKVAGRAFAKQNISDPHRHARRERAVRRRSVTFSYGDEQGEADYLVIAAGRGPDIEGLGLEEAGVELDDRGLIAVDGRDAHVGARRLRDRRPRPRPRARAQVLRRGHHRRRGRRGHRDPPARVRRTSRARRSARPNVASFGLTEEQAREQGLDIVIGKVQYGAVGAGTVYGDRSGVIKIIGDKRYGELVGGHIVGAKAVDLIQELVNAKALEGGYAEVARMVHGHPTFSEAVMEAARAADGWLIHG